MKRRNTYFYIGAVVLSSFLLSFSWPGIGNAEWLIFMAFIPLLFLEHEIRMKERKNVALKVFLCAYSAFLLFNLLTTSWIRLASPGGMVLAVAFNALFMALVFMLFHFTARVIGPKVACFGFCFYWTAFEYLHINWELSWIWLNLGNVFANRIEWIQWYEYTGTLGGTFWILMVNILAFLLVIRARHGNLSGRQFGAQLTILISLLVLPFVFSDIIFHHYKENVDPVNLLVVQPNIDPYNDKFSGMSEEEQIDKIMYLAGSAVSPATEVIVCPETAFPSSYVEDDIEHSYGARRVRELIKASPRLKFIVGLTSVKIFGADENAPHTARLFADGTGQKYDVYNAVMQLDGSDKIRIYRKSRLVLGVEKMPFSSKFGFLEQLSINLGGATGSLGTEKEPFVFESETHGGSRLRIIPAICYESIYGAYLAEFVRKGGNLLAVVTNDGWWGNTPGYSQHLAYSRLRAIELRRSVVRSANTGISAFINQRGEILQSSKWWEDAAIPGSLNLNNEVTFFAENGDYPGRISSMAGILLLVWLVVNLISGRKPS